MPQLDFIKDIAKYALEHDQEKLLDALNQLIEYSKKTKKVNFALQLQSILKEAIRQQENKGIYRVGSPQQLIRDEQRDANEFILEKITSDYRFEDLICSANIKDELKYLIHEHRESGLFNKYHLPISNKILFYGPSGCGKTLAAYVLAGELEKMMVVVNLGAIVSSKLGETSKNLTKVFKNALIDDCIIFIDEFDSLGKIRDYSQDHGEMKRVVNTILQLFDYLHQDSIVIAATNNFEIIDSALRRRFDLNLKFDLPDEPRISQIIEKNLRNVKLKWNDITNKDRIVEECKGLSFYSIQKTLLTTIKRSLFFEGDSTINKIIPKLRPSINSDLWLSLIKKEKHV